MNNKTLIIDAAIVLLLVFAGAYVYSMGQERKAAEPLSVVETKTMDTIPGLQIETLAEGAGVGVQSGQTAVVDYTGMLTDGKVFDSSIPRGVPFPVHLGKGEVIKGWDLGLVGMKVGEKRKLTITPELAYGKDGFPGVIPPNATLVFEVTLKAIQ